MDEKSRMPQVDTAGAAGTSAAAQSACLTEQRKKLQQLVEETAALSPQSLSHYLAYLDALVESQDTP